MYIALTIERTGMHRRVALAILSKSGNSVRGLMIAFMGSTALLSTIMSNTSIALIMVPIAVAVLAAGGVKEGETDGLPGALIMGVAFAATIGGLGTIVGSPTNAIAVGLVEKQLGIQISFVTWMVYGMPIVIIGVPLCAFILMRVQNVTAGSFDLNAARAAIGKPHGGVHRRTPARSDHPARDYRVDCPAVDRTVVSQRRHHGRKYRHCRVAVIVSGTRRHGAVIVDMERGRPAHLGASS